jgi:uncharacterized protein (DUF2252 family)
MRVKYLSFLLFSFICFSCSESSKINQNLNLEFESVKFLSRNRDVKTIIDNANKKYKERNPQIIEYKYNAMKESPFAFYRATSYIFYSDIYKEITVNSNIRIPINGDLHLENIGTYYMSDGKVNYDLNDFDESVTSAPYTYDLVRCIVSIYLSSEESGINKDERNDIAESFIDKYIEYLNLINNNPSILSQPITSITNLSKPVSKVINEISTYPYSKFINNLTENGSFKFNDKYRKVSLEVEKNVISAVNTYSNSKKNRNIFKVKSVAELVSGKASLGRYKYAVLIEGNTLSKDDDIILELKEAEKSTLVGSRFNNEAERIIEMQKYFLIKTDSFLGTTNINNIKFYVRRVMPDLKVNLKKLDKKSDFIDFVNDVALVVAKAHSRAKKNINIINDLNKIRNNIIDFSKNYVKQVKFDYEIFKQS